MKNILKIVFAFIISIIVITSLNSCNTCNNTDKEKAIEMLDSIKANDPYELNAEWLPYHYHKMMWGRGPNTLYSLKFNFICNKLNILNVIKNIKSYEDDSFYGTICKKHNIKYIDLHKKSFYLFHTKIKPLSETIKNMRDSLSYFNKIIL